MRDFFAQGRHFDQAIAPFLPGNFLLFHKGDQVVEGMRPVGEFDELRHGNRIDGSLDLFQQLGGPRADVRQGGEVLAGVHGQPGHLA